MTHLHDDPENPQEHSNLRDTRPIPRGPGTRYTRWTKAREGVDPELRMVRKGRGGMRESKPSKI